jgi:FlaA1/EpsC-like NDP-sugar epimerase
MNILEIIGRRELLFNEDVGSREHELRDKIARSRFLVIGGAGSIGQAVVREIFRRNPQRLDVVDISENNLVELVRDLRSTLGYIDGEFRTFAIDVGGREFDVLMRAAGGYDYVLNLSALKHVRSEKDPFTLMRMIDVNVNNTIRTHALAQAAGATKYFCVSTDKAANPVNLMGASKRIMEMFLMRDSLKLPVSTARFANVAFSDGSLLHGFNQRFQKRQPISAPDDVRRYFVTPQESGELCLMSCLLGGNREIFFPKPGPQLELTTFSSIAERYVEALGFTPYHCKSEDEARARAGELIAKRQWPCYFFKSNTTGEKDFEEFYTDAEELDMNRFQMIGVICNKADFDAAKLARFVDELAAIKDKSDWDKRDIVALFSSMIDNFEHLETGKYLDGRM